jgi:hypothetical protein
MDESRQQFVAGVYPAAVRVAQDTGVSWQLLLAQAVVESDYGRRAPAAAHNLFWQPAGPDWSGSVAMHAVREYAGGRWTHAERPFRAYGSVEDALRDHVAVLRSDAGLAELFRADVAGNPVREAQALQHAGYTSDARYAQTLAGVLASPALQDALRRVQDQVPAPQQAGNPQPGQADKSVLAITDTTHPDHALFAEAGRRIAEHGGDAARPEALAYLTLQMLEHGIRTPAQIRALAVSGGVAHVQGDAPGARASVDLGAQMPALHDTSERIARLSAAQDTQQPTQSQERSPTGP